MSKQNKLSFDSDEEEKYPECGICCSKYTKLNKKVSCPYCNHQCCLNCVKQYLVDKVECMNCKKEWNNDFIQSQTTKVWFNSEFKNKRKELLFDREKALLQSAMPRARVEKLKVQNKKELDEIDLQIEILHRKRNNLVIEHAHIRNRILNGLEDQPDNFPLNADQKEEKRKFVKACPVVDCKGFLSTQYKCELCSVYVCKDCFELKDEKNDEKHVCDPTTLNMIKEQMKNGRPCPKCGIFLVHLGGCNHFFCGACKTCFNWKTGEIMKNGNTNPHYHEWLRSKGENQHVENQNQRGNCISYNEVKTVTSILEKIKATKIEVTVLTSL